MKIGKNMSLFPQNPVTNRFKKDERKIKAYAKLGELK